MNIRRSLMFLWTARRENEDTIIPAWTGILNSDILGLYISSELVLCWCLHDFLPLSTVYRNECDQRGRPDGGAPHVRPGRRPAESAARRALPQPGSSGRAGGNVGGPLHTVSSTCRRLFSQQANLVNCVLWLLSLLSLKWSAWDAQRFQGQQTLWFRISLHLHPSVMMWPGDNTKR